MLQIRRMLISYNEHVRERSSVMNKTTNKLKIRNLSLCPITPDPPELLELIAEMRKHLASINFSNDSIYASHFTFVYNGVTYRMDYNVLTQSPAKIWKAKSYITDKLEQLGATNVSYSERSD